jgi:hypothetical protein
MSSPSTPSDASHSPNEKAEIHAPIFDCAQCEDTGKVYMINGHKDFCICARGCEMEVEAVNRVCTAQSYSDEMGEW